MYNPQCWVVAKSPGLVLFCQVDGPYAEDVLYIGMRVVNSMCEPPFSFEMYSPPSRFLYAKKKKVIKHSMYAKFLTVRYTKLHVTQTFQKRRHVWSHTHYICRLLLQTNSPCCMRNKNHNPSWKKKAAKWPRYPSGKQIFAYLYQACKQHRRMWSLCPETLNFFF